MTWGTYEKEQETFLAYVHKYLDISPKVTFQTVTAVHWGNSPKYGITDIKRAGFQVAYTLMNVSDDILIYDPSHPGEISNLDHVISMVRRILNGML